METEENTEGTAGPGAPKKSKLGLILATVVILVLVAGAAVAGTVLGPKLIGGENPAKPMSDNQIANLLSEDGVQVARRTVAKYREAMDIPSSSERKKSRLAG